jgi:D-inositol-3-phosphate glycosyltransferase
MKKGKEVVEKKKILFWADSPTAPTGWGTVSRCMGKYLYKKGYDLSWLAINYWGDPHPYPFHLYPASSEGTLYGFNRFPAVLQKENPDVIILINDIWVTTHAVEFLKDYYKSQPAETKRPKIIVYFPVDAAEHNPEWYGNMDYPDKLVCYNEFGRSVAKKAAPQFEYEIIGHGIDKDVFKPLDKYMCREQLLSSQTNYETEYKDAFIVFNANRNQPRKRLDITMLGFALFSRNKPKNVKLYMHCGMTDSGINIIRSAQFLGIKDRLIVTSQGANLQNVPYELLNNIYNVADVGINTSLGEGFGLPNVEQASLGIVQVVPDHSACGDLFRDCGIVMKPSIPTILTDITTVGQLVSPESVAKSLEVLYNDPKLRLSLNEASFNKFTSKEYSWEYIVDQWDILIKDLLK